MRILWLTAAICAVASLAAAADPELSAGLIARIGDGANTVVLVTRSPAFTLTADESLHPTIGPKFSASWSGGLKLADAGEYTFYCQGRVKIDDVEARGQAFKLDRGLHALSIDYERKDGPARLQFEWESKEFRREPVPTQALCHSSTPPEVEAQRNREAGRYWVEEFNCAACHQLDAGARLLRDESLRRPAPDLSYAGTRLQPAWILKWLEDPVTCRADAAMPAIPLTEAERGDIAAYLSELKDPHDKKNWGIPGKLVSLPPAETLFNQIGCVACHGSDGVPLTRIGSKYNRDSLAKYLLDPRAANPFGRMPNMFLLNEGEDAEFAHVMSIDPTGRGVTPNRKREHEEEARVLAAYLLKSRDPAYEGGGVSGDPARAEELIQTRGCLNCHAMNTRPDVRMNVLHKKIDAAAVTQSPWRCIGPFESGGKHAMVFPPELAVDLNAEYDGADGKKARWEDGLKFQDDAVHDLYRHRPNSVCYLYRTIECDRDLAGTLSVGSDDTITVWINGEKVHEFLDPRGMPAEKDEAPVRLKKGTNAVLLKIGNLGGDYQFYYKLGTLLPPLSARLSAPVLDEAALAEPRGCLAAQPSEKAPRFPITPEQREEILAFLRSRKSAPDIAHAPVYDFYRRTARFRCNSCHTLDDGPAMAALAEAPPTLKNAGAKLRPQWIELVLNGRKRIRPWMNLRMPHFGEETMKPLAVEFPAAVGEELVEARERPEPPRDKIVAGMAAIGKAPGGYACINCHEFRGQRALANRGPDMVEMFDRIRPNYFSRWMHKPLRILPGTPMPSYFSDLSAAETDARIDLLWSVLALGRGMPQPEGLAEEKKCLLTVKDTPIVIRAGMPESGSRSIAVGLMGYVSYCFDAASCRVRYAWFGEFLDVTPVRTGLGAREAIPLGKRFFTAPDFFPLRIGGAEPRSVHFRGYRLNDGLPEFHYEIDGRDVYHTIRNTKDAAGLEYVIRVDAGSNPVSYVAGDEKDNGIVYGASAGEWNGKVLTFPAQDKVEFILTLTPQVKK